MNQCQTDVSKGPGDELARLLWWFKSAKQCSRCKKRQQQMNNWGETGCKENLETIVAWLRQSAREHGFPKALTPDFALRAVIKYAISCYRKKKRGRQIHAESKIISALRNLGRKQDNTVEAEAPGYTAAEWPFVWTYWGRGAVNDELKYSMRSVVDHIPEARIVLIGDRPPWYEGDFIPCPRIGPTAFRPFKDCYTKILTASQSFEKFIWMMDDIYWLRPFTIAQAATPKFINHITPEAFDAWPNKSKNAWTKTKVRALNFLLDNNRPTYDFASHLPQPFHAATLRKLEDEHGLLSQFRNFELMYFNLYHSAEGVHWKDFIRVQTRLVHVREDITLLNHTHRRYEGTIRDYLVQRFPNKAPFEA